MKSRLILVSLGLLTLTILSFSSQAQEQPKASSQPNQAAKDELMANLQQQFQQFKEFQERIFKLKQKMSRGTPEERKRAEVYDKVLEECKNLAISQEFAQMTEALKNANLKTTDSLEILKSKSEVIAQRMRQILTMIQENTVDLSKQRQELKKYIEELDKLIKKQQTTEAITRLGKTDPKELENNQKQVTKKTAELAKDLEKFSNKDKNDKGGEAANQKGDNKDGGKENGKKGEAKDAGAKDKGSEAAKGESKDGGKDSKDAKPKGEAKAGDKGKESSKPGTENEPKANAKSGEKGKEGSPKADSKESKTAKGQEGDAKDNKSGQPKEGAPKEGAPKEGSAKDSGSKSGDPKKDGPQGEAKSGGDEKKTGEPKDGPPSSEAKAGPKSGPEGKEANAKAGKETGDAKSGDAKGGEAKGSADGKQGEAKSGEAKSGDAKDGGSPAKNGNQPPPGNQAAQKGDNAPMPPPGPPGAKKENDDVAKSAKKVKEAGYDQEASEPKIANKDNENAAKNQADAVKKMEAAKKQLERLLQQMREDELERVLAALQNRCEKMLRMQMEVLSGTEDLAKKIAKNADKKADRTDKGVSLKLSDDEKLIVQEANKCIDILEAEGSAVAFPEVFQQVRQDMIHVQNRLVLTEVGDKTQGIERDIIDTLKEMIDALKKAQEEMKKDKSDPSDPKSGKSGPPGDQKLLELIQELKMVRSLQKRINDRTTAWGRKEEQANEPQIIRELRNLSERQLRIQEIVSKIAKGDNK